METVSVYQFVFWQLLSAIEVYEHSAVKEHTLSVISSVIKW